MNCSTPKYWLQWLYSQSLQAPCKSFVSKLSRSPDLLEGAMCYLCPKCGAACGWFGPGIGVPGCPCLLPAAVNGQGHAFPYTVPGNERAEMDMEIAEVELPNAEELLRWGQHAERDRSAAKVTRHPPLHPAAQFCLQMLDTAGRNSVYYGPRWSFHQQGNMLASLF